MVGCLVFSTCFGQLCAHHQENSLYVTLVFFTLYGWLSGLLYMFRATMCPSSGELTVSMRHWYFSLCMVGCLVFSTCFGQLCAHHQENSLYLCNNGIFHSVWLAVWSSLHVSGNYVPIIRRPHCIYATLVFFTLYGWLPSLLYMFRATMCPSSGDLTVSMRHWYFSFCMVGCLVFSTCFGQLCAHHQETSMYLCDTGIFHSVWLTVWSSLHVSGNYVPIIRRTYCIYATLVFFTLYGWLSGLRQARQPTIQSEKYQCRIDTVSSPDDGHIVARNM